MGKKLRFCLSEKLQSIQEKISQEILPYVDLEWTENVIKKNDEELREFSSQIDNIKMTVKESELEFTFTDYNDPDGQFTKVKKIKQVLPNGDEVKSLYHKMLCDRFDRDDDIIFFRKVSESLYEHANIEKKDEDKGNDDSSQKRTL